MKDIRHLIPQKPQPAIQGREDEILDTLMDGVMNRRLEQKNLHAEALKEIRATRNALNQFRDVILSAIKAIPQTDLSPVLRGIKSIPVTDLTPALDAVGAIKFPEMPKPEKVDFTQVMQRIDNIAMYVDALAKKVDGIDVRPIVATSAQKVEKAEQPKAWKFEIKRTAGGGIKEVIATSN